MARPKKTESIETIKTTTTNRDRGASPKSGGGQSSAPSTQPKKIAPSPFPEISGQPLTAQKPKLDSSSPGIPQTGNRRTAGNTQRPTTKQNIDQKKPTSSSPKNLKDLFKNKKPNSQNALNLPKIVAGKKTTVADKAGKKTGQNLAGLSQIGKSLTKTGQAGKAISAAGNIAKSAIGMAVSPSTTVSQAAIGLAKNALSQITDSNMTIFSAIIIMILFGGVISVLMLGIASFYFSGGGGGSSAKLESPIALQIDFITDPLITAIQSAKNKTLDKASSWLQKQTTATGSQATSVAMELNYLGLTNPDGQPISEQDIIDIASELVDFQKIEETYNVYRETYEAAPDQFDNFKTYIKDAIDKGIPVLVNIGLNNQSSHTMVITGYNDDFIFTNNPDPDGSDHQTWDYLSSHPYPGENAYQAYTLNLKPETTGQTTNSATGPEKANNSAVNTLPDQPSAPNSSGSNSTGPISSPASVNDSTNLTAS